jgi:CRISPR-associated protein Csd1
MIIESLCRYYDILANDENVEIARFNYSVAGVSFVIVLSQNGELTDIVDIRSDEKSTKMIVPYQKDRTSNTLAYFMCDKSDYVFGINKAKETTTKKVKDSFSEFKALHNKVLKNENDKNIQAFLKFINNWNPDDFLQHPVTQKYSKDLLNAKSSANVIFKCDGDEYLHNNIAVKNAWEKYRIDNPENDKVTNCIISNKTATVVNTHKCIKGFAGAQANGAALVSFNAQSFCSYGFKQGENAPIDEDIEFKYTTVLNYLTDNKEHSMTIGNTKFIFWVETEKQKKSTENIIHLFAPPIHNKKDKDNKDKDKKDEEKELQQDIEKRNEIKSLLSYIKSGKKIDETMIGVKPDTKFYVLGLVANMARLSIRFWYVDNFDNFIKNIAQHYLDMEINYDATKISSYGILKASQRYVEKEEKATQFENNITSELTNAILKNTQYPNRLCEDMLNRFVLDVGVKDLPPYRVNLQIGLLKAYLLRHNRENGLGENLINVELNEENTSAPYCMGRLLSIMKTLQHIAMRNNVIEDKYYHGASKTPAFVFPDLILRSVVNRNKLRSERGGYVYNVTQKIDLLISTINEFPTQLTMPQQCEFAVGYHQQNVKTKKEFAENREKRKQAEMNEETIGEFSEEFYEDIDEGMV